MTSRVTQTALASLFLAAQAFGAPSSQIVTTSGSNALLSWQVDRVEFSGISAEVEASLQRYFQKKTVTHMAVSKRRAELRAEAYTGPGLPRWSLIVDRDVTFLNSEWISVVEATRFARKNGPESEARTRTHTHRFNLRTGAPVYTDSLLRPNAQAPLAALLHKTLKDASPEHPLVKRREVGDYTDNVEILVDGMVFHLDGTTPPLRFTYDSLLPFLQTRGPLAEVAKRATTGIPSPTAEQAEDYLARLHRESVRTFANLSASQYAAIRADADWHDAHDVDALMHMLDSAGLGDLRLLAAGVLSRARAGLAQSSNREVKAHEASSIVASLRNAAAEEEFLTSQPAAPAAQDSPQPSTGIAAQVDSR